MVLWCEWSLVYVCTAIGWQAFHGERDHVGQAIAPQSADVSPSFCFCVIRARTLSLQSASTRPLLSSSWRRATFPLWAAQNTALASGVSFWRRHTNAILWKMSGQPIFDLKRSTWKRASVHISRGALHHHMQAANHIAHDGRKKKINGLWHTL